MDVDKLILQRLPTTIGVIGASQIIAADALPVGVYAATRPYSIFDQIASTFALMDPAASFSPAWYSSWVQRRPELASFVFRRIVASGPAWWWEEFKQAVMPITVLATFQAATWTRFVRSAVLDVIRLDYVTTARSKGLAESGVVLKHIVRNALIPVVTLIALQLPIVFSGAIVTEQIFRVPGIGSLLISAILANDTPVIMGVTFVFACLVVLFNLIADLIYGWLDPRISYR
jgi:peptide/nickel transport system permease protein